MTVFVNYYTCSYGDSFVNMFGGHPVERQRDIAKCFFTGFIEPEFYNGSPTDQILKEFVETGYNVVPCHRQNKFDFKKLNLSNVTVITIIVDDINLLVNRFAKIHLRTRNKPLGNVLLNNLRLARPELTAQLIELDYKKWIDNNLLDGDVKFHLSWVNDLIKVEQFCQNHKLFYNKNWIENIKMDMLQYND